MRTVTASPEDILATALKVSSRDELREMSRQQMLSFFGMVERRLLEEGPPSTLDELQGFKQMVILHLWHPALSRLPEPPQ